MSTCGGSGAGSSFGARVKSGKSGSAFKLLALMYQTTCAICSNVGVCARSRKAQRDLFPKTQKFIEMDALVFHLLEWL